MIRVLPARFGYYPNHAGNTRGYQCRVAGSAGSGKTHGYPQKKKRYPSLICTVLAHLCVFHYVFDLVALIFVLAWSIHLISDWSCVIAKIEESEPAVIPGEV